MYSSKQRGEWHLGTADDTDESNGQFFIGTERVRRSQQTPHGPHQPDRLYEFALSIAILYGVAVFLVWQQSESRMSLYETDLAALRSELAQEQSKERVEPRTQAQAAVEVNRTPLPHQFETEYLRFEASARTVDIVKSVIQPSDKKYRLLHQDFGLPLTSSGAKLTIIVDLPRNTTNLINDSPFLVVPSPKAAAEWHEISEVDALTNEIFVRLSTHIIAKALNGRAIKPQWRSMIFALNVHLRLENGHNRNWHTEPLYRAHRRLARSRSLEFVQHATNEPEAQTEKQNIEWLQPNSAAHPLIEYMLVTYGYACIPPLLDAFEQHATWDTLVPTVFGIPANELEEQWHAYLWEKYL